MDGIRLVSVGRLYESMFTGLVDGVTLSALIYVREIIRSRETNPVASSQLQSLTQGFSIFWSFNSDDSSNTII